MTIFNHSAIEGKLCYFQLLAITINVAMLHHLQEWPLVSRKTLEVEWLGQTAHASGILIDTAKFPFLRVVALCNPKTKYKRSCFPTALLSNGPQTM